MRDSEMPFRNAVDVCIGTGRMGLALHAEYQNQLRKVQEEIGFTYIRGHGIFTDDMGIYQEYTVNGERIAEYNFTYLDRVMDFYRSVGLRPFLELSFMPEKLASGTQTVFYWKGQTTPPKEYERWTALVQATLRHLLERYGPDEVLTWPIEVWNEPNLPGFWYQADMQEYFKLFQKTFAAIKEVHPGFLVGGPAVCGGSDEIWIRSFLEFCQKEQIPVDFITRHHYTTDFPEDVGHYGYAELMDPYEGFANLHTTREIVDSFPKYRGKDIHITEFNTSYIPNCPLHDTNQNAACIAHQLARLGEDNASYSYWTFGDVFEERGVPFTPFHGGFGLLANGGIKKPVFWSFVFFKRLKEHAAKCLYRDDNVVVVQQKDGSLRGVAWHDVRKREGKKLTLNLTLPMAAGEYCLLTERVCEECCNPLKMWHDLGEPANPTETELALITRAAQPKLTSSRIRGGEEGVFVSLELSEHAVVYFALENRPVRPDRGYSYDRVMQYPDANPLTRLDYPDPDVIRVDDTYYMVSTTMYFMPGCEILRSYDLVNWEHAAYVYDRLDSTDAQTLSNGANAYGKGMWAASLRYHQGTFYICFSANDTHKTYLYRAEDINGPWSKQTIEGFYHDCSLLFDDDGRVYLAYGNRQIYITELNEDLTGPAPGGLHRMVADDKDNPLLGYEGSHFYKINGKYYLFFIHSRRDCWRRVEACFMADSLTGEFVGGDCLNDDLGYLGSGVAQGGIVDTPDGRWYGVLFQDRGAVGRIPVLVPVHFEGDRPVFGENGMVPSQIAVTSARPEYRYAPLVGSDDFRGEGNSFGFLDFWQFNHEPELPLVTKDAKNGRLILRTDRRDAELTDARNTLTQRMIFPYCTGEVVLDAAGLNEGDYAGLCALQGRYAFVGVTRRNGGYVLVMHHVEKAESKEAALFAGGDNEAECVREDFALPLKDSRVTLRATADFTNGRDTVSFSFRQGWFFEQAGPEHRLFFGIDHFTGCRFGLFFFSTEEPGGTAVFENFRYLA